MVAAHKQFPMPKKDGYMPVLVGAVRNYRPEINYQRDDDGENISVKNPNYNELTAVYWAWKNLKDVIILKLIIHITFMHIIKSRWIKLVK